MRIAGLSVLSATLAAILMGVAGTPEAAAQYPGHRSASPNTLLAQTSSRYVSRSRRVVATPYRGTRWFNAPSGAIELRGRYWDPRTRWVVDARTHSTYAVLSNGEVWFLEPTSGWGYTVDRYGRVYTCDPRRRSVYALNDLSSWRGDLYYFFSFFAPWDGYYTVRNYDWFYSNYYGRRNTLYDYGYAYNQTWDLFDDYYLSRDFSRSVDFHYYEPSYVRYDRGWSRGYWYNSVPSVYIAPGYNYTVINNTVVLNRQVYDQRPRNGGWRNDRRGISVNNRGRDRGLPTAQQAAIELAADLGAPPNTGFNSIDRRDMQRGGVSMPVEPIKQATALPAVPSDEPIIEIPGLNSTPATLPVESAVAIPSAAAPEPVSPEPLAQPEVPSFEEPIRENPRDQPVFEEPQYQQPAREEPVFQEPIREEPVYQEPVREEPVYQEPVREEPVYEEPIREEPVYQEPVREEPVREEPVREEPVYEEPIREEPVYQEPVREEPVYQEPAYEEPAYQEPEREEPVYEAPERDEPQEESRSEPTPSSDEENGGLPR